VGSKVIAVDVGGTFIDVVSFDRDTGEVVVEKQPSTPDRIADELLTALERLPGRTSGVQRIPPRVDGGACTAPRRAMASPSCSRTCIRAGRAPVPVGTVPR
jgi:hypothetical protein